MAYDLQEQESIDQMKAWWDQWGTPITAAVCVVCLGFAAWNGWQWYQRNEAGKAAVAYAQLQQALVHNDAKNVSSLSTGLIDSYGTTIYAPMGALAAAQASLNAGDFTAAESRLKWVIESSKRPEYETLARVRLAGVYFDAGKLDEALKLVDEAKPEPRQVSLVLDRKGDILAAKGDIEGARKSWQEVLDRGAKEFRTDPILRVVEYKLGSLPAAD